MKRVQLFEFEDQKWFPDSMRIALTKLIAVIHKWMGMGDLLAGLIKKALHKSKAEQIVDLGSGAGGSMPQVVEALGRDDNSAQIKMILTDLYPNKEAIKMIKELDNPMLEYHENSVDATHLENAPDGLKTMVNSFHHMPPEYARKILKSAHDSKQSILIYEMAENKIPLVAWWLFLPVSLLILIIMVLIMTPFVRPLTFQQLFFTYIIPVIPIFYAWDGQASLPRIYALSDFEELTEGLNDNYHWEVAPAKRSNGKQMGYYVLGTPA